MTIAFVWRIHDFENCNWGGALLVMEICFEVGKRSFSRFAHGAEENVLHANVLRSKDAIDVGRDARGL